MRRPQPLCASMELGPGGPRGVRNGAGVGYLTAPWGFPDGADRLPNAL
jgi:hypothetical protein